MKYTPLTNFDYLSILIIATNFRYFTKLIKCKAMIQMWKCCYTGRHRGKNRRGKIIANIGAVPIGEGGRSD